MTLHEPKNVATPVRLHREKQTGRFQIVKLEERIAPHKSDDPLHKHGRGGGHRLG